MRTEINTALHRQLQKFNVFNFLRDTQPKLIVSQQLIKAVGLLHVMINPLAPEFSLKF